jgi:nicotinamide riboside transporter PnuC
MFEIFKWSLTLASLAGVVLNIRRDRRCFYLWSVTNASWTVVDTVHGIHAQAALQAVYFGLALWGIRAWKRESESAS